MVTESDPSSGTAKTKAAFIQFRIPTIEEAGLHAKSQIFTMQLKTNVTVAGANVDVYKVKSKSKSELPEGLEEFMAENQDEDSTDN